MSADHASGSQVVSWNAHRIDEAIAEVHMLLKDANQVLAVLKHNVTQTRQILASWATPQPFDRKEGKVCLTEHVFQPHGVHHASMRTAPWVATARLAHADAVPPACAGSTCQQDACSYS